MADCDPSFLIGRMPVIYAAAIAFVVKFPFLNQLLNRCKYDCFAKLLFSDSLMIASHSSMMNTNFFFDFSTYFKIQSLILVSFDNSGNSAIISFFMDSAIFFIISFESFCCIESEINEAISK